MSSESRHTPEPLGPPERSPWGIATIALIAGTLQVVASIALGIARLERFNAAAAEKAPIYMVVAVLVAVGVLAIWLVRRRPPIAVTLTVAWPLGMWLALRSHTTVLGLAYHGEFVLHHFSALLCLILATSLPIAWARDPRLGPLRIVPLALALPGAVALAAAHLGQLPIGPAWLASRWLPSVGAMFALLAWPMAVALFWKQLGPRPRRPLVCLLLLPVLVRLGLAGEPGLTGALVADAHAVWVGAAIVVTGMGALIILRPRLERWVMVLVGSICLVGSMFVYYLYEHGFGEFEDGLGGLLESLFGFAVPYPPYVDDLRSAALMMGLFFTFVTVYTALVSFEDRIRGVALGLMVVAGIGFSSPHLVLMYATGALLLIETMLPGAPHRELDDLVGDVGEDRGGHSHDAAVASVREIFEALAERLALSAPAVVELDPRTATISLRGELDTTVVDLRARIDAGLATIELIVGLPGRGEPLFELLPEPGSRGQRPAHLLARSHRVRGEIRGLEAFGDAPLDALTCFPTADLRAWDGGVEVGLGRELVGLRVDHLEALIRSLARALGGP